MIKDPLDDLNYEKQRKSKLNSSKTAFNKFFKTLSADQQSLYS